MLQDTHHWYLSISSSLKTLEIDQKEVPSLLYLFSIFTLIKALENPNDFLEKIDGKVMKDWKDINQIANSGVVIGYSEGDELILGHFKKGTFIRKLKVIKNGEYKNPSSAEIKNEKTVTNITKSGGGVLWYYLYLSYKKLLQELGVFEQFLRGGEREAILISKKFRDRIFLNGCARCGGLKRTAKARLCPNCADFTESINWVKNRFNFRDIVSVLPQKKILENLKNSRQGMIIALSLNKELGMWEYGVNFDLSKKDYHYVQEVDLEIVQQGDYPRSFDSPILTQYNPNHGRTEQVLKSYLYV